MNEDNVSCARVRARGGIVKNWCRNRRTRREPGSGAGDSEGGKRDSLQSVTGKNTYYNKTITH